MNYGHERDVTTAVLAETARAPDARFRELLTAAVAHLHAFGACDSQMPPGKPDDRAEAIQDGCPWP